MTPTRIPAPADSRYVFIWSFPDCEDDELFGRAGAAFRRVLSERPLRETHLDPVGRVRPQDVHHAFVGFGTRPVLLQFEYVLGRGDRNRTGLDRAVHRAVV